MDSQTSILKDACELLRTILDAWGNKKGSAFTPDLRKSFINRHAWNIHELGSDVVVLSNAGKLGSIYLLSRPALESMFKLAAAVADVNFVSQKVVAEIEEERKKIQNWQKSAGADWTKTFDVLISELEQFKNDLKKRYNVTNQRDWKVYEVAKLGNLQSEYVRDYFLGSKHVHAMLSALTDREDELYVPEALYRLTVTVIHTCALVSKALMDLENCGVTNVFESATQLHKQAKAQFDSVFRGLMASGSS